LDAATEGTINDGGTLKITDTDGAMTATAATDTFVVDAADTGLSIAELSTSDILDLTADSAKFITSLANEKAAVDAAGEWFFGNETFTYFNGTDATDITLTGVAAVNTYVDSTTVSASAFITV